MRACEGIYELEMLDGYGQGGMSVPFYSNYSTCQHMLDIENYLILSNQYLQAQHVM